MVSAALLPFQQKKVEVLKIYPPVRLEERNLFLNLAEAIQVFDLHFNFEFVLLGILR